MKQVIFIFIAMLLLSIAVGNTVDRIGYAHKQIRNMQQNLVHRLGSWVAALSFMGSPYFIDYDCFKSGIFHYSGFYNPNSLFSR
jgi:hypothetical protein